MSKKNEIIQAVNQIANEISGPNAFDVDQNSRFPIESFVALKASKVLSAGVPETFGGAGMNIVELGELCKILSAQCASTAMILGMHFIKVSSIVYFGRESDHFEEYLRSLAKQQRLVASVTSEEGVGGNLRNSISAVEVEGDRFMLTKHSTCLSYGAQADDLLITCRRSIGSAASDQVLVLAKNGDFTLEQTGEWNAMGMRGTCSPPFTVSVNANTWQIFKPEFREVAARTMVPDTHCIWSNIWLGIACDAARRARTLVQNRACKDLSQLPENAGDLVQMEIRLERFIDTVKSAENSYLRAHIDDNYELLSSVAFSLKINTLKLNASQLVADICIRAMAICGFSGYINSGPFSIARHLRDALSAAPMIDNGRLINTNATYLALNAS